MQEITKKQFNKLRKTGQACMLHKAGTDYPYILKLNQETQGTELVPVQLIEEPKAKKLVWSNATLAFPIAVMKTGKDQYTVQYGKQVKHGLNYESAAKALGFCMFHAFQCEGKLD